MLWDLQGSTAEALDSLLGIEKVQRLAEDVTGTRLACQAILEVLSASLTWSGFGVVCAEDDHTSSRLRVPDFVMPVRPSYDSQLASLSKVVPTLV